MCWGRTKTRTQAWIQAESSAGLPGGKAYIVSLLDTQESPVRDRSTTVTYRGSVFLSDHDAVYCFDSG